MPNIKIERIINDLRVAKVKRSKWEREAKEDFEYVLGKQWEADAVNELRLKGVRALTINKVQPFFHLVSGIQRQNRTDYVAFPVGAEDSIQANIVTRLLKNVMRTSDGSLKQSQQFEDGIICGEGYVEPFIDYTYDLINGQLRISKSNPFTIYTDPKSVEFDLSDAKYVIKITLDLLEEDLIAMFPEKEKQIKKIRSGKIQLDNNADMILKTTETREKYDEETSDPTNSLSVKKEKTFDLVEYYYKKLVNKYVIVDQDLGKVKEVDTKAEAEAYIEFIETQTSGGNVKIIKRNVPEIWIASVVGGEILDDKRSWTYPKWKSYPFIPFYAHRVTTPIKDTQLMVQGIVRSLKDPQRELNKRRTQELHIINTSANSGWLSEEGAWKDKDAVRKFGSSAGVILEYKANRQPPKQLQPTTFPAGHKALAEENADDMKQISGINTDLLAQTEGSSDSGRALLIRQKQGLVMIQRIMDNFEQSKRMLGKFLISQLGEIFTVESAIRVLGDAFIREIFSRPVLDPQGQPQQDEAGEILTEVNPEEVNQVINTVLNDSQLNQFDVAVGEGAHSETTRFSNHLMLLEFIQRGLPIPPEVVIEESMISEGAKAKIIQSLKAQAQAVQEQQ